MNIDTPEKAIEVSYNGNYICFVGVSGQVYCSAGFAMLAGVEVPWQRMDVSLTSISVAVTGTLIGINANKNILVAPDCMKPFWLKSNSFNFIQVITIDGNTVWGISDSNQLLYTSSLQHYLLPHLRPLSSLNGIIFGDALLSRLPHASNDHNPVILEKRYEKAGTSFLRLLANSFRIYSCAAPPCLDADSQLKFVFQDGIFSSSKGICINNTCLSEQQLKLLLEMLDYFYTAEEF
jgi:hypothetical protein